MSSPLQRLEWMVRIPVTQMEQGITYLSRLPDDKQENLRKASDAMLKSIGYLQRWCEKNGVELKAGMKT